ncbi:MAG TPA: carboxypeptidase-like regulatory domain-containing protein [Blastocatellia bacterium]|nr:carboxypeptidase-like regulatory domain-containing protein [Blastocatellia bacterium]
MKILTSYWRRARATVVVTLVLPGFIFPVGTVAQNNQQLLSQRVSGLTILTNTTQDFVLPSGCVLSGTITDSEEAPVFAGSVTATAGDQSYTGTIQFSPFPLPPTARYRIVLPPGTYVISATVPILDEDTGSVLNVTYRLIDALNVTCNTTRNLTLPDPPRTFLVQGRITSAGSLPPRGVVSFFSDDGQIQVLQPQANGSYKIKVPAGQYRVTFGVTQEPAPALDEILNLNMTSVTVTGDRTLDLTLPAVVTLQGKITDASGQGAVPSTLLAFDIDESVPFLVRTNAVVFVPERVSTGNYRMVLPQGTYNLLVSTEIRLDGEEAGLSFPIPGRQKVLTGDSTEDFLRPELGPTVTLSGKVTDSSGRPVADAQISVSSSELVNVPGAAFTNSTETRTDGTYSLKVLPGRQYTVTVTP